MRPFVPALAVLLAALPGAARADTLPGQSEIAKRPPPTPLTYTWLCTQSPLPGTGASGDTMDFAIFPAPQDTPEASHQHWFLGNDYGDRLKALPPAKGAARYRFLDAPLLISIAADGTLRNRISPEGEAPFTLTGHCRKGLLP